MNQVLYHFPFIYLELTTIERNSKKKDIEHSEVIDKLREIFRNNYCKSRKFESFEIFLTQYCRREEIAISKKFVEALLNKNLSICLFIQLVFFSQSCNKVIYSLLNGSIDVLFHIFIIINWFIHSSLYGNIQFILFIPT